MNPSQPAAHSAPPDPLKRRPLLRLLRKVYKNWRERHRLPFNLIIHLFGIPIAVAGFFGLFFNFWWGLAGLVVGYALQYVGHRAEGNDVGEWAAIKRMLGMPYVSISPRWQTTPVSPAIGDSSPAPPPGPPCFVSVERRAGRVSDRSLSRCKKHQYLVARALRG